MSEKKSKKERKTVVLPHFNNADLSAWIQALCTSLNFSFETLLGFLMADFAMALEIASSRTKRGDYSAPFMAYLEHIREVTNNFEKWRRENENCQEK